MKRLSLQSLSFLFLSALLVLISDTAHATMSFYSTRTQRLSMPQVAGVERLLHQPELEDHYGLFKLTTGYTRTFKEDRIAKCLFGNSIVDGCLTPTINITGSRVANRGAQDWLADYFGLPTDFQSKLLFEPRITNFIAALQYYIDFPCFEHFNFCMPHGLYFAFYAPFVHTSWKLGMHEQPINIASNGYVEGYFGPAAVANSDLVSTAIDFFNNQATPDLNNNTTGTTVTFEPLQASRLSAKKRTQTRFAELVFELGYKLYSEEDCLLTIGGFLAAPTGGKVHNTYFFDALVGNGRHTELGASVTFYHDLWQPATDNLLVGLWINAYISHLFSHCENRVFDLIDKDNSRYMLAEQLGTPVTNLFANTLPNDVPGSIAPSAQFKNRFAPVANLTASEVKVKADVQVDVTAMLNFQRCNYDLDFGYRFWYKSCDKIKRCSSRLDTETDWALKGDAAVYGFASNSVPTGSPTITQDTPIALSATESKATIYSGTNNFIGAAGGGDVTNNIRPTRNPFVDNAQYARDFADATVGANINDLLNTNNGLQTKTSKDPIFLSADDINICSAKTEGMSHTVFINLNYTWFRHECWIPFVAMGGKVEFADRDCNSNCNRCTPNEWGVWFTIGVSFE